MPKTASRKLRLLEGAFQDIFVRDGDFTPRFECHFYVLPQISNWV